MDLSVCIVNWNTRELLQQCLYSVYGSADGLDIELIVVDNASSDGSADMVCREFPAVRLLPSDVNTGFAGGMNLAVGQSTGRYVLLLNSDTIVLPGALAALKKFMDDHPEVGIAGPKLLNPDGSLQPSFRRFPSITLEYISSILISKLYQHARRLRPFIADPIHASRSGRPESVDWVSGACMIARRVMFSDIGVLDEGFFMYCEEIEWCYRARRSGWKVYYMPDASIIHYSGASSSQAVWKTYLRVLGSTLRYFLKLREHKAVRR